MEKPPFYFLQEISEWFVRLEEQDRKTMMQLIKERKYNTWLKQLHNEIRPAFDDYLDYLVEELRTKEESEVEDFLSQQGPVDPGLFEALVSVAKNILHFYFDSAGLREIELAEFSRITSLVIKDHFIERRYSTLKSRMKYLQSDDEQFVRNCYNTIINLVMSFYEEKNFTLEKLETFMKETMRFDENRITMFTLLLLDLKPSLDLYFLNRQVSMLREFFDSIEVESE